MSEVSDIINALHEIDGGLSIVHSTMELGDRHVDLFHIKKGRQTECLSVTASELEDEDIWRLRDEGIVRWYKDAPDDVREAKGLMPKSLDTNP